jgi:hypothetical protein
MECVMNLALRVQRHWQEHKNKPFRRVQIHFVRNWNASVSYLDTLGNCVSTVELKTLRYA